MLVAALTPPSNLLALAALPAVALDLETTGLDVRNVRIVQVGAIAMLGARILDTPRLAQNIDPGVPIPEAATRIHGLTNLDMAGAPRFAEIAPVLRDLIAGHVVIGHHVAFDLAVLRHEAARAGVPWPDPPFLDIALLWGALEPALLQLDLETITGRLGVEIRGRHSARGDAMAAAEAFAAMIPRMREREIRTLGEAHSLAARRDDLVLRQAQAGWYAKPQNAQSVALPAPARLDSFIFERRIADVMSAPAEWVSAQATLLAASKLMIQRRIGALLVGAPEGQPEGIVTERDVLRAAASGEVDLGAVSVGEIMSTPVEGLGPDAPLYRALGRMDRMAIRHLCVMDEAGRAIGVVSQRDLLRHRARAVLMLGDAIAQAEDSIALAAAYGQMPEAARKLVAEGVGGVEVARVVSDELRELTGRAAQLAAARLRKERGEAPAAWCFLVLGSGGRGESLLVADQDNALIHAGNSSDDGWYAALGELVAEMLHAAGVPRCTGGVMAANPEWRGSAAEWGARIEGWLRRASRQDLLSVDIFFDLRAVAGDARLGTSLQRDAVAAAKRTPTFIALLAESVSAMAAPLGLFGRLRTENGRVDLKRNGLLPVVSIARTLALRVGSAATSTPDRLRDAAAAGRLAPTDAELMIEIHANLIDLVLQQQLMDLEAGVRPSSRVATQPLGRARIRQLASQLRRLEEIQQSLRAAASGTEF